MRTVREIENKLAYQEHLKVEQHNAGNYNNQAFHEGWIFALKWIQDIDTTYAVYTNGGAHVGFYDTEEEAKNASHGMFNPRVRKETVR